MKRGSIFFLWVSLVAAGVVPDRYIVQLEGPPAATVASKQTGRAAAVSRRAQIAREQAVVRAGLEQTGARVTGSVDIVANALFVSMPDSEAHRLAGVPGVAKVYRVYEYKALLDRAVPLHRAPQVWEILGGNDQAGAGMKIAVLDTGIDINHPGFKDESLQAPEGYPRASSDENLAFTNAKIIVARSYAEGEDAQDRYGHGTAVAMAAAGASHDGPSGTIFGMAPKAWLGNYRITRGSSGSASTDAIANAVNDAIADGMDVLNLSFGDTRAERPSDDFLVQTMEMAVAAGVIVVISAGNSGSDPNTIGSPATAPSAIAVGATRNRYLTEAILEGFPPYFARPSVDSMSHEAVSGPLFDVSRVDPSGLACEPLPEESVKDKIAFILRGDCTFETKLTNAEAAGAIGALLYSHEFSPEVGSLIMANGLAFLPALIVSNSDGLAIKEMLTDDREPSVTLDFTGSAEVSTPPGLASFSSRGPSADLAIKPDLVSVGADLVSAFEMTFPEGGLYSESGYGRIQGTSFSAPITAGAAALVRAARPGLTVQEYRSLLINSATPLTGASLDTRGSVQLSGAGLLNVEAAARNTIVAFPTSLSFGAGEGTIDLSRDITIANLGTVADTFVITAVPFAGGPAPNLSATSLTLEPGDRAMFTIQFSGTALDPGAYQGFIEVQGMEAQAAARIPYWYAVPSGVPTYLTILDSPDTFREDGTADIYFRVTDQSGVSVAGIAPEVTVAAGGGEVVTIRDFDFMAPGMWRTRVRMGPDTGVQLFDIAIGELKKTVHIQSR